MKNNSCKAFLAVLLSFLFFSTLAWRIRPLPLESLSQVLPSAFARPATVSAYSPHISAAISQGEIVSSSVWANPPASASYPMAYDAGRNLTVLYTSASTWEYSSTVWQPMTTTHVPHLDAGAVMTYDQDRGLTVLAGLRSNYYRETWEYDGIDWTQVTPTISYPPFVYGALVEDSGRGRLVSFGGMSCAKPGCGYSNDTREYTGTTWAVITTTHAPAPRSGHAMAYDAARGVTVLFGGASNVNGAFSDTWEYDGADWRLVTPTVSPPGRAGHAMVYDVDRGVIVLFGGIAGGTMLGDTWEYDGATWQLISTPVSPPARSYQGMVYDAARRVTVLYGGRRPTGGSFGDTWEYDGSTWRLVASSRAFLPFVPKGP